GISSARWAGSDPPALRGVRSAALNLLPFLDHRDILLLDLAEFRIARPAVVAKFQLRPGGEEFVAVARVNLVAGMPQIFTVEGGDIVSAEIEIRRSRQGIVIRHRRRHAGG